MPKAPGRLQSNTALFLLTGKSRSKPASRFKGLDSHFCWLRIVCRGQFTKIILITDLITSLKRDYNILVCFHHGEDAKYSRGKYYSYLLSQKEVKKVRKFKTDNYWNRPLTAGNKKQNQGQHLQKILWSAFKREKEVLNHSLEIGHFGEGATLGLCIWILRINILWGWIYLQCFLLRATTNSCNTPCLFYLSWNPEQNLQNTSDWHLPGKSLSRVFPSVICLICPGLKQNKHIIEIIHFESKLLGEVDVLHIMEHDSVISSWALDDIWDTIWSPRQSTQAWTSRRTTSLLNQHPDNRQNSLWHFTSHWYLCLCTWFGLFMSLDINSTPASCLLTAPSQAAIYDTLQLTFHCYHREMKQDNNVAC